MKKLLEVLKTQLLSLSAISLGLAVGYFLSRSVQ